MTSQYEIIRAMTVGWQYQCYRGPRGEEVDTTIPSYGRDHRSLPIGNERVPPKRGVDMSTTAIVHEPVVRIITYQHPDFVEPPRKKKKKA